MVDQDSIHLNGLNKVALALHPSGKADSDLHSLLLQAIERLWDARQERLLAAQTTIPDFVWFVVIVGGALTVAFASFFLVRRACGCNWRCRLCWPPLAP
jgi:hypothetical protein